MENIKAKIKNFIFTLIAWGILLTIVNFICGFISRNNYVHIDPNDKASAKSSYGYFRPQQHKRILLPGLLPYTVTIDAYGLRTVGIDANAAMGNAAAYRILCLGDSITFGLFVDDADTYPYRLQKLLINNNKDAVVFNAGVGSATVDDYLYYLKVKGLELNPDLVIINFCSNDVAESIHWQEPLYKKMIRENKLSFFKKMKLMKFMRMFRHFEVNYKYRRYLKKIKDPRLKDILTKESKSLEDILYVAAATTAPEVLYPHDTELKNNWQQYFSKLTEVIELLEQKQIKFIYVIYPDILTLWDRPQGYYQDVLKEFLEERGVEYVDLTPRFRAQRDNFLKLYNNLPRDFHLSGYGNQVLAEELIRHLEHDSER